MKPGIDYIGVGSGALIFNKQGKVLLTKSTNGWEFPSTVLKFGEKRNDAIRRHARKLGMKIEIHEILDVVNHILYDSKEHWLESAFLARCNKCTLTKEHRWEKLCNVTPEELAPKTRATFLKYIKKRGSNAPIFIK